MDEELLAIVESPAPIGMTTVVAFKLKEEALAYVMSELSVVESRAMYRRLATPIETDKLATAFAARFVGDRRSRLLAFLADAPRRAAIGR